MAPPAKKKRSSAAAAKPPPGPVFDQSMRPTPLEGPGFRVLTWNVAGLRALLKEVRFVRESKSREREREKGGRWGVWSGGGEWECQGHGGLERAGAGCS